MRTSMKGKAYLRKCKILGLRAIAMQRVEEEVGGKWLCH